MQSCELCFFDAELHHHHRVDDMVEKLVEHEGLETITDFQGRTWCISPCGTQAVLLYGPALESGQYTWEVARAAGLEVDLHRPMSDYPDNSDGPCHREIHAFLQSQFIVISEMDSTAVLPVCPV